jgi:hypothetical protein
LKVAVGRPITADGFFVQKAVDFPGLFYFSMEDGDEEEIYCNCLFNHDGPDYLSLSFSGICEDN